MARLVGPKNICVEFMSDNNHTDTERSKIVRSSCIMYVKQLTERKQPALIFVLRSTSSPITLFLVVTPLSPPQTHRHCPPADNPHVACRPRLLAVACRACPRDVRPLVPAARRIYPEQLCPNRSMYARPANARISLSINRSIQRRATPGPARDELRVARGTATGTRLAET